MKVDENMKKVYKKPIIEIITCDVKCLNSNSEPEETENIGAKENTLIAEDEMKYDENWLWEDN